MENGIARACAEADRLTGTAGARLRQGQIASPAAFRLAKKRGLSPEAAAERMAAELALAPRYFSAVLPQRGYLNFALSEEWYRRTEDAALLLGCHGEEKQDIGREAGFPAAIVPFDGRFLAALGEPAAPERSARQDRENPGWLVRYTARRLARFAARPDRGGSPEGRRAVLLAAAALPAAGTEETARALVRLARQVWAAKPQRLPPKTAEAARRTLLAGISLL